MPSWLVTLLGWLGFKQSGTAASSTTPSATVAIETDIGAVAGAVSAGAGLVKQIDAEVNTPALVAAKENAAAQADIDAVNRDLQTGNLADLQKRTANL